MSANPDVMNTAEYAVAFSSGIRNLRYIERFLGVRAVVSPWQARHRGLPVRCVIVWGRKQNSQKALGYAAERGLPVKYVEDGWIRSCSANAHSRVCYSLLIDDVGVYYDGSVPSALEKYLNLPDDEFDQLCGPEELAYAAECRHKLVNNNITKYNFCSLPDQSTLHLDNRPLVLVLDQTRDDASVLYGGMDSEAFVAMLNSAIHENPESRVVVRAHPDVVVGRRKGYLQNRANQLGIEVSAVGDNPIPWLKHAKLVYTATSQLGYEALLCGCRVKVAGKPFYAGWGVTEDCQSIARRIRDRTLDQIFYITHSVFAKYCCPVTGQCWSLNDCLDHVLLQQQYFSKNAGKRVAIGITPWKRRYLAQFLRSPDGELRFADRITTERNQVPVYWSFSDFPKSQNKRVSRIHEQFDVKMRVEDGFIRSVGLGSDYVPPASLVFDSLGLYFDAGRASALEKLLNEYSCTDDEIARGMRLRDSLCAASLTKYNVCTLNPDQSVFPEFLKKRKVLVIGQVAGDQSLLRGAYNIQSNAELLRAVREENPDSYITYKPHPDVVSKNRTGKVAIQITNKYADNVVTKINITECLDACDELHTMTSLSGFEALLRGKKVVTYGLPFYSGWGLTQDKISCERRFTKRSVNELTYICLAIYPHYIDLDSGEFISVDLLVDKIRANHFSHKHHAGFRWFNKMTNIANALTYKT